jgi:hypothetical protein
LGIDITVQCRDPFAGHGDILLDDGVTLTSGGAAWVLPHLTIAEENTARSVNDKTSVEIGPMSLCMRSVSPVEGVGLPTKERKCKPRAKAHGESDLHKWLKRKEGFKDEIIGA